MSTIIIPKVGDWVKLVSKRPPGWNTKGEMDEFLGKTVQVNAVNPYADGSGDGRFEFEGGRYWAFQFNNIESIQDGPQPEVINDYSII